MRRARPPHEPLHERHGPAQHGAWELHRAATEPCTGHALSSTAQPVTALTTR